MALVVSVNVARPQEVSWEAGRHVHMETSG
jgi:hypothetical protein